MMCRYKFLPRRLKKEEIALASISWLNVLSGYSKWRKKAMKEAIPGYNTLCAMLMAAIAKHDKTLVDTAINLTKEKVPEHVYMSLAGSALCELGAKDEGLNMLRQAVALHSSHTMLLTLAADTDDLDEKEELAQKVLSENPEDKDALRCFAYAKYFKGEHREAESLIDKILLDDQYNIFALRCKGNIYFDKKNYEEALQQYLKIKLNPMPVSLKIKQCHCYHLLGELDKAKKIARKIQSNICKAYDIDGGSEKAKAMLAKILSTQIKRKKKKA